MAIKINGATVISDSQAFTSTSTVSASGNITGGNVVTTGNVNGNNVNTLNEVIGNIIISRSGEFGIDPGQTVLSLSNTRAQTVYIGAGLANLLYIGNSQSNTNFGGNISVAGNIIGNVTTSTISASGNITGNYILGNGSQLTGIDATSIQSGTSNVRVVSSGGNVAMGVGGTSNVVVVSTTGQFVTGLISATGNITGGNLLINGNAQITGNLSVLGTETIFNVANLTVNDKDIIVANNVTGGANVDGSGIQAGNPATATWFFNNATTSWQSNIGITPTTNGTLALGGTSNYWGTAFITTASVTGNVQAGNIRTAGIVSATGNITGGNITTAGRLFVTAGTDNIELLNGVISASGNVQAGNIRTTGLISATGNISGSFFIGNGSQLTGIDATAIQNGTANVRTFNNGNVTTSAAGTANVLNVTSTGTITTGDISLTGNIIDSGAFSLTTGSNGNLTLNAGSGFIVASSGIVNGQANGVGNIGATGATFNTIFARATSALYADLAEKYTADADYAPGTVVMFGGTEEVTLCVNDACPRVAGVISTNPSYRMNDGLVSEHTAMVALTGRVPCRVAGTVRKGDLMVSAGNGSARAETNPGAGTVIGKALADHDGAEGVIEVVVGRL